MDKVEMKYTVELIPVAERTKLKCRICGTNLSVKYRIHDRDGKPRNDMCYCNRCVIPVMMAYNRK